MKQGRLPSPAAPSSSKTVDQLASQQRSALARVNDLLGEARIAYWLFGGWAVDFYAGSVTRAHDDLDVAVWLDDLPGIAALLEAEGWHHAPEEGEDGGTGYEQGAVRLELTYLVRGADGGTYTPMSHGEARWSEEALADDSRELNGVSARLIALAPLMRASPRLATTLKKRRRIAPTSESCPGSVASRRGGRRPAEAPWRRGAL